MTTLIRPDRTSDSPAAFDRPDGGLFAGVDAASVALGVAMWAASAGGLLLGDLYRDNTWSKAAFRGGDMATALFAVPVLLISLAVARRGSSASRLVWLGVLAYNVYNYGFYLFGTTFNDFFLLYALLFGGSVVTGSMAAPRAAGMRVATDSRASKVVAAYMVLVGVVFGALWITASARFVLWGEIPETIADSGIHTNIVFALDLSLLVPGFIIGGVSLWRRRPAGVVLGVVMNVLGALYMLNLALAATHQAAAGIEAASWSTPPYLELGVTSFLATALVLRSSRPTGGASLGGRGTP